MLTQVKAPGWIAALAAGMALAGCALSPQAREQLQNGQQAYLANDDSAAIQWMSRFVEENPRAAERDEAYYWRGLAEYRKGELQAAQQDFEATLKLTKRSDLTGLSAKALGDLAYDRSSMGEADGYYQRAIANLLEGSKPMDEVLYRRGEALQRMGQWQDADLQFSKLIHNFAGGELAKRAGRLIHCRSWTVQVAAMKERAAATDLAGRLKAKKLNAFVQSFLSDGEPLYTVQVGRFADYDDAAASLAGVRKFADGAFVAPTTASQ